jgi:hypothetical protein
VFQQREPADRFYVLLKGEVSICMNDKERMLEVMHKNRIARTALNAVNSLALKNKSKKQVRGCAPAHVQRSAFGHPMGNCLLSQGTTKDAPNEGEAPGLETENSGAPGDSRRLYTPLRLALLS